MIEIAFLECLRCGHPRGAHLKGGECADPVCGCKTFIYEASVESESHDRLEQMWDQQKSFMDLLREKRDFPEFPVDLASKGGQKFLKQISYECADELHEARQHLRQKDHRAADVGSVDREEYIEELSDALHFYLEIVIASGISKEELFEAYMKKGLENVRRINTGY